MSGWIGRSGIGVRAALALVLLEIVAVSSTAGIAGGERMPAVVLTAVAVLLLVPVALGLTGFAVFVRRRGLAAAALALLAAVLFAVVVVVVGSQSQQGREPARCGGGSAACEAPGASGGERIVRSSGSDSGGWTVEMLAVAGSLLAAGAAAVVVAVRRRPDAAEQLGDAGPVVVAVAESVEDLRRERDVRRAIVACYARMERAFAAAGAARLPAETPFEFLSRVLERVAAEAGRRLTELFERAKFSLEPLGVREKEEAIAALEELRAAVSG